MLPARFKRPRIVIVGCGDVGLRIARILAKRGPLWALTSSPQRLPALRTAGITPLRGNLDQPATLRRLAGIATHLLYLAPPPATGQTDPRSVALKQALGRRTLPQTLVYLSTTGIYGDCAGAWIDETRSPAPTTARAQRRVAAERTMRHWGRTTAMRTSILRVPGIYAHDRDTSALRARLLCGTPVLQAQDDVYTNHIHADDLARVCIAALWRASHQRIYHVSDQSQLKMGDWFDLMADRYGLPRPPRSTREHICNQLSPIRLSFMSESRRLHTQRLTQELRIRLHYPKAAP